MFKLPQIIGFLKNQSDSQESKNFRSKKTAEVLMSSVLISLLFTSPSYASVKKCQDIFADLGVTPSTAAPAPAKNPMAQPLGSKYKNTEEAWQVATKSYAQLMADGGRMQFIVRLLSITALSGEFAWLQGAPGGAKTAVSRKMFKSILMSIPDQEKKIFLVQFHKMMNEGKIVGFQNIKAMMAGRFELETSTSLVDPKFLLAIFDEAEKANPAVLNSLLSVLNERKVFYGSRVLNTMLRSGVFTSNKTMAELIVSAGADRTAIEALAGRQGIKGIVPNQTIETEGMMETYLRTKTKDFGDAHELPLFDLEALLKQVKFSDELIRQLAAVVGRYDADITARVDEREQLIKSGDSEGRNRRPIYPANDFSNRSIKRLLKIMAASFLIEQLEKGTEFKNLDLTMDTPELHLMAAGSVYVSPGAIEHETFQMEFKTEKIKNGAKEEEIKGITVSDNGLPTVMLAKYDPWKNEIEVLFGTKSYFFRKNSDGHWKGLGHDFTISEDQEPLIQKFARSLITKKVVDLSKPKYKMSSELSNLLENGIWSPEQFDEIEQIALDTESLVEILNSPELEGQKDDSLKVAKPQVDWDAAAKQLKQQIKRARREEALLPDRQFADASTQRRLKVFWGANQNAYREMTNKFPELDHYVQGLFASILSGSHAYVFGPPGGAKTMIAELVLSAELRSIKVNERDMILAELVSEIGSKDPAWLRKVLLRFQTVRPHSFKRFFLQFHKMMPEGVIVGFPKLNDQLEGRESMEYKDSLASSEFIFAILDEVDKANPATLTSLLSVLNEREVFAGSSVVKVALRTAIITSNKLPSETLESFYEDRSAGEALLDRIINKIFVMNKFSTLEATESFLLQIAHGGNTTLKSPMSLEEMRPLVEQVRENLTSFQNRWLITTLADVQKRYLKARAPELKAIRDANQLEPDANPYYHILAASPSDRTFYALVDQFPIAFILKQLTDGVPFEKIRLTPELSDLTSFYQGLGYWTPVDISHEYTPDGLLQLKLSESALGLFATSPRIPARIRFASQQMLDDAKAYVAAANASLVELLEANRQLLREYPNLFPSLLTPEGRIYLLSKDPSK